MSRIACLVGCAALVCSTAAAEEDHLHDPKHPLALDKTGIRWVYPFKKALAKAKQENRLLLILPLAGGGGRNAGNW